MGLSPQNLGLVNYSPNPTLPEDFVLVKVGEEKSKQGRVYTSILDPLKLTESDFIDPRVWVKTATFSGFTDYNDNYNTSRRLMPIETKENIFSGVDPVRYGQQILSTYSSGSYADSTPPDGPPFDPLQLIYGFRVNETSVDLNSLPYINTNTSDLVDISYPGGSFSVPAHDLQGNGVLSVTYEEFLGGFEGTVSLQTSKERVSERFRYAQLLKPFFNVKSDQARWMQSGSAEQAVKNSEIATGLIGVGGNLISGALSGGSGTGMVINGVSGMVDLFLQTKGLSAQYQDEGRTYVSWGGDYATSSRFHDYLIDINYPVERRIALADGVFSPKTYATNIPHTFDINERFSSLNEFYVNRNIYGRKLVGIDFEYLTDLGYYSELAKEYISRGGIYD